MVCDVDVDLDGNHGMLMKKSKLTSIIAASSCGNIALLVSESHIGWKISLIIVKTIITCKELQKHPCISSANHGSSQNNKHNKNNFGIIGIHLF